MLIAFLVVAGIIVVCCVVGGGERECKCDRCKQSKNNE